MVGVQVPVEKKKKLAALQSYTHASYLWLVSNRTHGSHVLKLENQFCDDSNATRALDSNDLAGLAEDKIRAATYL